MQLREGQKRADVRFAGLLKNDFQTATYLWKRFEAQNTTFYVVQLISLGYAQPERNPDERNWLLIPLTSNYGRFLRQGKVFHGGRVTRDSHIGMEGPLI